MARGPGGDRRTQEWLREEQLRVPAFPGEGSGPPYRGGGRRASSLEWGRGRLGLAAIRGGGEGRPETRGKSPGGPHPPGSLYLRPPPPASAPPRRLPRDRGPGQVARQGGGRPGLCRLLPAEPNSSRARPGSALPVLCRRCPVTTASPVTGCSQVVLFASSLQGGRKEAETGREWGRRAEPRGPERHRPAALSRGRQLPAPLRAPRAGPGPLLDEEDAAAPGDPVSPGAGQGADPLQVQIRRHV